jgi:ABC-type Fe3+/spermidine/putrescine transport system ATPase subunit
MLEVQNITKSYEGKPLLKGISFSVNEGQTVCLLGASGSGKSTLLRIIAGIETQESGTILWDGKDISNVPVHKRGFGLMFQDYALFPHRNVFDNVAFGLKMQGFTTEASQKRVFEVLDMVSMAEFARRKVTDLSGGEQQRVAFARALAPDPKLLMFDEPLGALDRTLREQVLHDLRDLLHKTRIPAIYVTHDQEEAFSIGHQIILTNEGVIVQQGKPEDVYRKPATAWVARFLGQDNLIPGVVKEVAPVIVATPLGELLVSRSCCEDLKPGCEVTLLIPPASIQSPSEAVNVVSGKIEDVIFKGQSNQVVFHNNEYYLNFASTEIFTAGETVQVSLDPQELLCLPKEAQV